MAMEPPTTSRPWISEAVPLLVVVLLAVHVSALLRRSRPRGERRIEIPLDIVVCTVVVLSACVMPSWSGGSICLQINRNNLIYVNS
ncbi:uncharacterized protein LOC109725324 isoform X1 [Ananas comosus]|uniref:Uncharacterized protein LOC109725324 isoform X1 n=1 Tax=Ananas comosus TaxID=4615 RepID=A0A6P5GWP2_ANACO|nr:uncharacterized protein LOC109725324 isoform X1 [Ananas comosus]